MATCDPAGLLATAVAFQDLSEKQLDLAQVALLSSILGEVGDPSGLIAASKCFECLSDKQLELIKAQLLCDILAGA